MEDEALKDSWTWLDEVLRLDSEAPSGKKNTKNNDEHKKSTEIFPFLEMAFLFEVWRKKEQKKLPVLGQAFLI